jgi:hypothetical protein
MMVLLEQFSNHDKWYGSSCAHCFVDYQEGKTDTETHSTIKLAANNGIFKKGSFVMYIHDVAINIDPNDILSIL